MDRKVRAVKSPGKTRNFHSTRTEAPEARVGVQRIRGPSGVQERERELGFGALDEASQTLVELFNLLEDYAPAWYKKAHHDRALAAIKTLEEA